MGQGPDTRPSPWFTALAEAANQQQQSMLYPQQLTQGLGAVPWQDQTARVGQWFAAPNEACHCDECMRRGFRYYRPSLTTAEFAEDYYDQCCGTPRSPKERAQELLFDHLTWEEREEWWLTSRITVTAKSGRRYWISGTDCGRYDDGHTFCVYIGMNECPAEDRVLGLKLAIETDEKGFLKTAVDRGPQGAQQGENPIFQGMLGQYQGIPQVVVLHDDNTNRWERFVRWMHRDT